MSDRQFHKMRNDQEMIQEALDLFFVHRDRHDASTTDPPLEVERAVNTIVAYYTQRLIKVVRLLPTGYLARIYESQDLYCYAWATLWLEGARIKHRTPAGVYQWLKRVILNHKIDVEDECRRLGELAPLAKIERLLYQPELKEFLWDDELQYRWDLIQEFFEKALGRLDERRQQVIKLVWEGRSLDEIKCRFNFPSRNAVSTCKRRALQRIAHLMGMLLKRELDTPGTDLRRREIIVELLERFHQTGGASQCLIAIG